MRDNLKADAYMTVEATAVVSIMIFMVAILMYMVVFVFDRTILTQDTYTMTCYAKEEYRSDKDMLYKNMDGRFTVLYGERPYMSFSDLSMNLSKQNDKIRINSKLKYYIPFGEELFGKFTSDIESTGETDLSDPVTIMLKTRDIMGWKE